MRKKIESFDQKGISLVEVLASLVIISILFSIISSTFISSYKNSGTITNQFVSEQLAESLLNVYEDMDYSILTTKVGKTEPIDIPNLLQIDSSFNLKGYTATAYISNHSDPSLSGSVIQIKITVNLIENGVSTISTLEGYKRK